MPVRNQAQKHTLVKIPRKKGIFRQTSEGLIRERRERRTQVNGFLGGGPPRVKRIRTGTTAELFFDRGKESRGRGTVKDAATRRRKQRKEDKKQDNFGNR